MQANTTTEDSKQRPITKGSSSCSKHGRLRISFWVLWWVPHARPRGTSLGSHRRTSMTQSTNTDRSLHSLSNSEPHRPLKPKVMSRQDDHGASSAGSSSGSVLGGGGSRSALGWDGTGGGAYGPAEGTARTAAAGAATTAECRWLAEGTARAAASGAQIEQKHGRLGRRCLLSKQIMQQEL